MSLLKNKMGNAATAGDATDSMLNPMPDPILDPMPDPMLNPISDPMLGHALTHFRQSVHAWSEAAASRPRKAVRVSVHRSWRLATGWALGCVLAAGSLASGIYEHHHRQVVARLAAQAEAAREQQLAAQRARESDEDLLATVDSDVSRAVPAAMEPLAQLMDGDDNQ
jgi:hypothetical protein